MPRGHFSIKKSYWNSHHNKESLMFYLHNGKRVLVKMIFILKQSPGYLQPQYLPYSLGNISVSAPGQLILSLY